MVRNVTYKASTALRYFLGSSMTENQVDVKNVNGQIRVESVYNPYVKSLDMHVFKPESNTFFDRVELPTFFEFLLPRRMSVPRSTVVASPS